MVKLFPWEMTLNVEGKMRRIELTLQVNDISKKPYDALLKIRGLDKDIEHIVIELPLGQDPQKVESVSPDDLKEYSKKNSKTIVDLFKEVVMKATTQLDGAVEDKESVYLTALRNIAKIKDNADYDKSRIISYVETVLSKT